MLAAASLPSGAQGQAALVVQGGTLIDGNGGAPVPNSVIIIQGNRITAVGTAGQVQAPAGAQVIDARGKWITPGLIDSMSGGSWLYGEAYLYWGVTSAVVNVPRGNQGNAERDAIAHGIYPGARLFQTVVGNGGANMKTPDDARARVRAAIAAGADIIGTGDGVMTPEVMAALTDEAHKAGKGVQARCVGPATRGVACSMAGADVMLHTGVIGVDVNKDPAKWKDYIGLPPEAYCDMDPAKEKAAIAVLVQNKTAVVPNFIAIDRRFPSSWKRIQQENRDLFSIPELRAYYPEYAVQDLADNTKNPEEFISADQINFRTCGFKNHAKFIGDLMAAGGRALPSMDDTQSAPGLGVQQDMAVFQEDAHVPPMKIITAATKWAAEGYHLKDLGTIEVGKLADLVLVNADPSKDILNMRQIDRVIQDGKVHDHAFHPWYAGWMFSNDRDTYDSAPVSDLDWVMGVKNSAFRGAVPPPTLMTLPAPNGKPVNILTGVADVRKGPGFGPVPNYTLAPTPGIETIAPQTVVQGSDTQTVTLTGINFIARSVAYVNGAPVPTKVESGTKISFQIPTETFAQAGKIHITVKNPLPLATPKWGDTSNAAHILVPFSFTTQLLRNQ